MSVLVLFVLLAFGFPYPLGFHLSDSTPYLGLNYALLAMSRSLPVIFPKESCINEFAGHFKEGLFVEEDNAEEWSKTIIKLQQDKRLRLDLGRQAKTKVEDNFPIESMVKNFLELL